MSAGLDLQLRIGQRVRHSRHNGERLAGVVEALTLEDRVLIVKLALDVPLVIPAGPGYRAVNLYFQHVPAHECVPFDERDELIAQFFEACQTVLEAMDRGIAVDRDTMGGLAYARLQAAVEKRALVAP